MCRAFVYSQRGSKQIFQVLMPRIQAIIHTFTSRELCYMMYGYHKVGFLPKPFAKMIEQEVSKTLSDTENIELE